MKKSLAYGRTLDTMDVVLVQDNRGAQAILRSMIASFRVKRLRVYDRADDALKDMMIDPPSVVITDWEMKPMSGYRFTRLVRNKSMEPLCYVPIIVVSGSPTMSFVDRAFSNGVNNIMVKPVAPTMLRRRLEWLTQDARGFELKGDQLVVRGMDEILETRVRRNDVADMLKRQKIMQEALTKEAQSAQDLVDRIVNGEVDVDLLPRDLPGVAQSVRDRAPADVRRTGTAGP